MKVLICSRFFAPLNIIGAKRPTVFAEHLSDAGYEITVICEDTGVYNYNDINVYSIPLPNYIKKRLIKRAEFNNIKNDDFYIKKNKYAECVIELRRHVVSLLIDLIWYFKARKVLNKNNQFDVVISSFSPVSSLLLGLYFKRKGIAKYWVSDLRDTISNTFNPFIFRPIYSSLEFVNAIYADRISMVSKGQVEMYLNSTKLNILKQKLFVLYNGFNSSLNNNVNDDLLVENKNKLIFSYTGSLYNGKRDLTPIFKCLFELIGSHLIDSKKVEFNYAGPDSFYFYLQLEIVFGREYRDVFKCHNVVSHNKAIELQKLSDVLIVLSWNTKKEKGILTGKFLEYLMTKKKVLGIVTGEVKGSELSELICKLGVGMTYEYANESIDYMKLKKYIHGLYRNKIEFGIEENTCNEELINEFDYTTITSKLIQIIEKQR